MKEDIAKLRHARSKKDFPNLKLEEDEYVELAISRSKIGIIGIWAGIILCGLIIIIFSSALGSIGGNSFFNFNDNTSHYLNMIFIIILVILFLIGYVGTKVYSENKLYVTNYRAIQISAISLFTKSTNVIDLISIEDVSFKQSGIIEAIFKLGEIRMSTVGDETTYTFPYVDTPTDELEVITHLVHEVKKDMKKTR
ncbi:PH domain-containing protein [Candidatus Saccharibacteria bacterium]|jgi:hypothetical protein|nr:PH domain-containing protein [Candidatus Saccharibacteria bacterium]